MPKPTCPTHGIPLVAYCPACRGATGGKVSSPAKVAASRENAAKARQASQAKRRIPGDASAPDRPP
jgi:aryl-alcohol dehydrogenase-like predicted oxidoreductase